MSNENPILPTDSSSVVDPKIDSQLKSQYIVQSTTIVGPMDKTPKVTFYRNLFVAEKPECYDVDELINDFKTKSELKDTDHPDQRDGNHSDFYSTANEQIPEIKHEIPEEKSITVNDKGHDNKSHENNEKSTANTDKPIEDNSEKKKILLMVHNIVSDIDKLFSNTF